MVAATSKRKLGPDHEDKEPEMTGATLFSPLTIGGLTVRNRLLSSADLTNFAEDGLPTLRHLTYCGRRPEAG